MRIPSFSHLLTKRRLAAAVGLALLLPPLAAGVEALARARLDDPAADAPTRVFARPHAIAVGEPAAAVAVEAHLRRAGYAPARGRTVGSGEFRLGSGDWTIGRRAFRHGRRFVPAERFSVRIGWSGAVTRIEDGSGAVRSELLLEPEPLAVVLDARRQDRIPVPLSEMPRPLVEAVLAVEDQRFFEHGGLDLRRIAAAAVANLRAGRVVQGASTLTQQLAKNRWLSPDRTWIRKLREAAMAVVLEARHSKREILEAYLNEVYLGQEGRIAIHGVGRAARHWFAKDVSELELPEAALLAGLIRGPSLYSPRSRPEAARERRNLVLARMLETGRIGEAERRAAREAPLGLRSEPAAPDAARYFVDLLRPALEDGPGLAVFTTLDGGLQRAAESAVRDGLEELERTQPSLRRRDGGPALQAALVALDPRTGEILALVGGRDYGASQFDRATAARRQPGSAFKPVVALAALARPAGAGAGRTDGGGGPRAAGSSGRAGASPPGTGFTLATVLPDEPLEVQTRVGPWRPVNYDGRYRGPVTLREALERSLNVPFARLGVAVGPARIVETARALGIRSPLRPYPSLALGAFEVTPLELTRAYAVLAAGGRRPPLRAVLGMWDAAGDAVSLRAEGLLPGGIGDDSAERPTAAAPFRPAEAFLVTSALRGAVERGTGRSLRTRGFRGQVAAKSGTTNDFRDGWFVGYTPSLAVGVWVGFDDGRSLGLPGAGVALPLFARFLVEATGPWGDEGPWGSDGFRYPAGLEVAEVDPATGLLAGPGCAGRPELFLAETAPERSCSPFGFDRSWWRVVREVPAGLPVDGGPRRSRVSRSGSRAPARAPWEEPPPRRADDLGPTFERLLRDAIEGRDEDLSRTLERLLRDRDLREEILERLLRR